MPVAIDGTIDLSEWDFEKDGIVDLKGEWRFVWNEFVEPMPSAEFREKYRGTVEVPSNGWLGAPNPYREGEFLPGQGYATYVLEIRLPLNLVGVDIGLAANHQGTSARYFVIDAQSAAVLATANQGRPGVSKESSVPLYVDWLREFRQDSNQPIQVWMEISNFHAYEGGYWNIPTLGLSRSLTQNRIFQHGLNSVIFGICLIISLYHLILFWQRREDNSALFFGVLCLVVAVRQWTTGRFSQSMGLGYSEAGYNLFLTMEYLTMPVGMIFLVAFIYSLIPTARFLIFVKLWTMALGVPLILLTIITSPMTFPKYLDDLPPHFRTTSFLTLSS